MAEHLSSVNRTTKTNHYDRGVKPLKALTTWFIKTDNFNADCVLVLSKILFD